MNRILQSIRHGRNFGTVLKQDKEIKKLNGIIQEKDQFIEELVKKYGVTVEAKKSFSERLRKEFEKKNLEKSKG